MSKVNCSSHCCVFNQGGLCSAERIVIEGFTAGSSVETFCDTFVMRSPMEEIKAAVTNTNYSGEIMQLLSSFSDVKMSPEIHCHATRCFYNASGICGALDVAIIGQHADSKVDTLCETFVE